MWPKIAFCDNFTNLVPKVRQRPTPFCGDLFSGTSPVLVTECDDMVVELKEWKELEIYLGRKVNRR
jgi:hypothetical protein